jgi:tetratricopeptide (TPR) repeat protein
MTDYYAILGVSRNATQNEVRDAYLKLARETHPDKVKDPEGRKRAEDAFKNVTAAYDTLSKDRSRREYAAKTQGSAETSVPPVAKSSPPIVKGPPLPPRDARSATPPSEPAPAPAGSAPSPSTLGMDTLAQGIEAFKKQDYHTAVQLLNMAVSQNTGSARAHAMLSLALAKNPNWVRDALNHMETAAKLDPKNVVYQVELALLLQSQGLKLRAKRAMETAFSLSPDHPDVVRGLKEIPLGPAEGDSIARITAETARGLFDRLRKR